MSDSEWLACCEPDLILEEVEGEGEPGASGGVRAPCWERITPHLPEVRSEYTVVEEFAALATNPSDHDAVLYASEAALKAARWAPNLKRRRSSRQPYRARSSAGRHSSPCCLASLHFATTTSTLASLRRT
jgi:hypothetical protein